MKQTILIVAAHADDETLGCGGTIARHVTEGDDVHVIFLTDGVGSRRGDFDLIGNPIDSTDAVERNTASLTALAILGVPRGNVHAFSFPDNALDSLSLMTVVKAIESVVAKVDKSKPIPVLLRRGELATYVLIRPAR